MAHGACWASWADALEMIHERVHQVAESVIVRLHHEDPDTGCVGELRVAAATLDRQGFLGRPQWDDLRRGVRPPPDPIRMSQASGHMDGNTTRPLLPNSSSREAAVLTNSSASIQAYLWSHSGYGSSHIFCGSPSSPEFHLFRTLVLERLRLLLQVAEASCECGARLDSLGRHRAACLCSGRLRSRALAPERTIARVCREAGATVRCNAKLREMNVDVAASDERAVEVLASGLPLYHGAQLAVDITLRSGLSASGLPRFNAAVVDGVVCGRAGEDKERKHAELLHGDLCRLVVVALETGGRWSQGPRGNTLARSWGGGAHGCNFVRTRFCDLVDSCEHTSARPRRSAEV